MKILLVAATAFEIAPFLEKNPEIDFLITGVGLPAATYHLTKSLINHNYDIVLQAGIAGRFTSDLSLGEVVLVRKDRFADIGVMESGSFKSVFDLGFAKESDFPFLKGWVHNNSLLLQQLQLPVVTAVSISKISDSPEQTRLLFDLYHPAIETMEGAACHYVCLQEKVAFLQIRSVSNHVGERDKSKWQLKKAITNLNTELDRVYNLINAI